ncbi:hypothetical protein M9H77_30028 [Catharanthus roseus]|uniref:Uncharacterized protein n=1 Tax=Catharanthus roseus TaxID=4058 RepID=A0ACB9ZWH1_CATRO|nr:hypothetical protein M9H77_30028 [Catharanthus roseus]
MKKRGVDVPRRDNFQDKMKRIGGKLHHNHKETSISFSSNSSPLSIEFSCKELKMNDYYSNVANVDSYMLGIEDKEECMLGESIVVLESENNWEEFLEKAVFEEVCRKFCDLGNFVNTFPRLKCEVVKPLKHEEYSSLSDAA